MGWSNFRANIPCAGNGDYLFYCVYKYAHFIFMVIESRRLRFLSPGISKTFNQTHKGTGSIFLYLLRYLITNKNYLLNTAGLCVIAGVMPFILGQFEGVNVMPLGFAVLCLNTPICILLSRDPRFRAGSPNTTGTGKTLLHELLLFYLFCQYGGKQCVSD